MAYDSHNLPLNRLLQPVAEAGQALTRLDERLRVSPVGAGWIERQNFVDAMNAMWLAGELVHLEDLVLHDARMDVRTPTHELARAHAVLRARRTIIAHEPNWVFYGGGIELLASRAGDAQFAPEPGARGKIRKPRKTAQDGEEQAAAEATEAADEQPADISVAQEATPSDDIGADSLSDEQFAAELSSIDALLRRTSSMLGARRGDEQDEPDDAEAPEPESPQLPPARSDLIYDLDWNQEERLAEWRGVVDSTEGLPVSLRAAIALDAWRDIEPLQHASWLGVLYVSALLRQEGLTEHHLATLNIGMRVTPREKRLAVDRTERLETLLNALRETAVMGIREHDRLALARTQLQRRLGERRSSSRLPELIELVLSSPIVSTSLIQKRLKVTRQGALNLVTDLKLREMTGRGRFKAWGVV